MLLEAHQCLGLAISQVYSRAPTTLRPPSVAKQALEALADAPFVASAHMQGGVDINISSLSKQMNLELLSEFITKSPGVEVNEAKEKHNSAHFSNIGVYVNVQSFTLASHWPDDGRAYLNIYRSGKVVAMAVPDKESGEELSDFIAKLLYDACKQHPEVLQDIQAPKRQRQKK